MPKFFNANDLDFIKTIAEEVVDYVVEQTIVLYKVSVGESKTNLYGESLGKIWHAPAPLMAIVNRDDIGVDYEGFGADRNQTMEFRFMRERLRTESIPTVRDINGTAVPVGAIQNTLYGYPEIGDVIRFDNSYFEIDNVEETRLETGSPTIYDQKNNQFKDTRMQLIVSAFMVRRSQIQIEDRVGY